jgi:Acyclic terpene utilisation family protein AtuA
MNMPRATRRLLECHRPADEPLRVLSASGQLGYGIPADSLARGMAHRPHFIGADMGSIDPGPYYLGSGQMAAPEPMVRRDLELVLHAALDAGIPLIIGSAGTVGARPQLEATAAMVREIARNRGWSLRLCTVHSDLDTETVLDALNSGRLAPIGPMPMPTAEEVRACAHIVGQCGTETLARALATDPDVVLAGRACDTAIFATLPELLGYPSGLAMHMAKIIECTSLCCRPGGRDAMLATLDLNGFTLESMNPACHATPTSVAAHALYEQADPLMVEEPTGTLLLDTARYEAIDEHRTRVSGARFLPRAVPSLKIEGASRVGARAVLLAGVADPTLLTQLDEVLTAVTAKVQALLPGNWQMHAHVYGQGAVAPLAPERRSMHEAGMVLEFIATDAALARTAAGVYKQQLLHHGYPGRVATAGNLAFAFTPSELDAHEAFRFVLYHVMEAAPIDNIFRIECHDLHDTASD